MKRLYKSLAFKALPKRPPKTETPRSQQETPANDSRASDNDGFHLVFEGNEPSVDIVALHGQGGNWKTSWTDHVTGCFWLRDLLPDVVPNTRVLSFGYGASTSSITVAEEFLANLIRLRTYTDSEERPIIFLAHSFGGIMIKGILAKSHGINDESDLALISASTRGILFFGVPRKAESSLHHLASASVDDANDSLEIQTLKRDFRWVQESNAAYSQISQQFETKYIIETAGDVPRDVPQNDERREELIDGDAVKMGKTHGQMIRFPNASDSDFQNFSKVLTAMVAEAAKEGNPRS